jgi:mannobiose 2-epimerase
MHQKKLSGFSQSIHHQLHEHILPFWSGPALDHKQGGWLGWMANDLRIDRSQPKGLIVNSRILWTYSAVFREFPEKNYEAMAGRAYEIMTSRFWDEQQGGAFWRLTDDYHVLDDVKKVYGQSFYIYAMCEHYLAFGNNNAKKQAIRLFELIEQYAHDQVHGGYFEVCHRDWSLAENASLSEKDMDEKKSMNNHLHILEAYTNLYRIWKDERVERRLRELIHLFVTRIFDTHTHHLNHFFDEQWRVRSNTYTFGHDIEASWLLCEAAEVVGDATLLEQTRLIALQIADTTLREGMNETNGLCYEGRAGQIIDNNKEWWPQTEAVVGFLNAFQLSADEKFFDAARRIWDYVVEHFVDRAYGEWFWRILESGQVDTALPKVSEWKGPYHNSRACLESLRRLKKICRALA